MDIKKNVSFRSIFTKYILYFIFGTILIIALYTLLFTIMYTNNIILPANYAERKIESKIDIIANSNKVTEDMLPEGCNYGVFDLDGNMLYGNFNKNSLKNAWTIVQKGGNTSGLLTYYKAIPRKNDLCIIEYHMSAQFRHPLLKKFLIDPEPLLIILLISSFILEVVLLSVNFGKYFSKEMKFLTKAAENIKRQNLDFEPDVSSIKEIQEVINSLTSMKEELKDSLKKQWDMEQKRKNQISALAHDIKTPLTIIKGNSELIKEVCEDPEQIKYNSYVLKSADEIEHYLKLLIDVIKSENTLSLKLSKIETKAFIENIITQINALAFEKNLQLIEVQENVSSYFYGDSELLYRGIMNVITNAVEYSPINGQLLFKVQCDEKIIQFLIADSGNGFSKEEIKSATEQFYQGDKSRASRNHHGLGLSITKSFITSHNGTMELDNSIQLKGAQVILKIPLDLKLL